VGSPALAYPPTQYTDHVNEVAARMKGEIERQKREMIAAATKQTTRGA
jgi:hypothetical protein